MTDTLISALRANSTLLANASSNVANMNSQDYKPLRTAITEGATGGIETVTTRSVEQGAPTEDGHQASTVDLPREFSDMILAQRGFESALAAIRTREDMMADLMEAFSPGT